MSLFDMNRLILPLKRKIFLLIGRAILVAVDNTGKTQKLQGTLLATETATGIERLQEYGFETNPVPGTSEALVLFINGNRDQGIAIVVHDRENRPKTLKPGDTMQYDFRGNKITCSATGIDIEDMNLNQIKLTAVGVEIEDLSQNKITTSATGINVEDLSQNKITTSATGVDIEDASGNKISTSATGVDINNGNLTVSV